MNNDCEIYHSRMCITNIFVADMVSHVQIRWWPIWSVADINVIL